MTVYGVGEHERGMVLVYNDGIDGGYILGIGGIWTCIGLRNLVYKHGIDGGYMEKHIGYMTMH